MAGYLSEKFVIEANFALGVYDRESGELVDFRRVHNVMTNTGRDWAVKLFG